MQTHRSRSRPSRNTSTLDAHTEAFDIGAMDTGAKKRPAPPGEHAPKPHKSYVVLINEAISSVPERRMILSDIYDYFLANYPYFRTTTTGWKNSIRHNLSLSSDFIKIPRDVKYGAAKKGMYWALAKDYAHRHGVTHVPLPTVPVASSFGSFGGFGGVAVQYAPSTGFSPAAYGLSAQPSVHTSIVDSIASMAYTQIAQQGGRSSCEYAPVLQGNAASAPPFAESGDRGSFFEMPPKPVLAPMDGPRLPALKDVWMGPAMFSPKLPGTSPKLLGTHDAKTPASPFFTGRAQRRAVGGVAGTPKLFGEAGSPALFNTHDGVNI